MLGKATYEQIQHLIADNIDLNTLQNCLKKYDFLYFTEFPLRLNTETISFATQLRIKSSSWETFPFKSVEIIFTNTKKNISEKITLPYLKTIIASIPTKIKQAGYDQILITLKDTMRNPTPGDALILKQIELIP